MNHRMLIVLVVAAGVVLSVTVGATLWLQRESLEIRVTDVSIILNAPESGWTRVHADLVLHNVGSAPVQLQFLTLFANDPENGTLYDTFTHTGIQLGPAGTLTFSETTNVTGHRSRVAFTVKIFPSAAPSWDSPVVPDQPVTWTSG